jgi:hypothetical protein
MCACGIFKSDFYRHALDYFYVITRCIIGWQQCELGSRCTTKGFNNAVKDIIWIGICYNFYPFTYRKFAQLGFFKIGGYPKIIGLYDRK